MKTTHFPQFQSYAKQGYGMVPIAVEMSADTETPITLYRRFRGYPNSFLLESVEGGEKWARYSFIGFDPFAIFSHKDGKGSLLCRNDETCSIGQDPIEALRLLLAQYRSPIIHGLPRLTGGAVGYFAYDAVRYIEKLPDSCQDLQQIPDCHLLFCDQLIAYDHFRQTIMVIVNASTTGDLENSYQAATEKIARLCQLIANPTAENQEGTLEKVDFGTAKYSLSQPEFIEMVERAKQNIIDGDIFQVVLSRRVEQETNLDPFAAYRALRSINPSPYMYFFNFTDFQVVGASPEMLVRVDNVRRVETCPIAGTRKRGSTPEEDTVLARELLEDEKEVAEHMMLVDLGRNDIGRVAVFGSVKVDHLKKIEKYSHVMHIVSNVSGILDEGKDALDALSAVFPAGTLTGAPKVRAMELIDAYETLRRGIYGGAAGYISFDGSMDFCIIIRTFLFRDGVVSMQSGGGIVYDSVAEKEFEEAENKVKVLRQALIKAGDFK